jgi:predicted phage terminase large subunit-like protein
VTTLNISFHPAQKKIFDSEKRFKVVAAGRRFGKTRLAIGTLIIQALTSKAPKDKLVFYVAPTFQQAKELVWDTLKEMAHEVITSVHENTGVITLVNGRKICLKGSDRPDTMRGVGLCYCVIDEYADMKPNVWEQIIRPALSDVKGGALFIGTPKGRNHFYALFKTAEKEQTDYEAFHFTSFDNPYLDPTEIEAAKRELSSFAFRQEFMASFEAAASDLFKPEWIKYEEQEPEEGDFFIAVDLAGFEDVAEQNTNKKAHLDQTAVAIVKVHTKGWWVKEILYGRWDVRETAVRIIKAARDNQVKIIGIEKGALKNAVTPYIRELMQRTGYWCSLTELTHGNKKKTDRIVWSLQGRFEHGRVKLNPAHWNNDFVDQLMQFPDPKTHDDLVDALSYIDQLASIITIDTHDDYHYEPADLVSGY